MKQEVRPIYSELQGYLSQVTGVDEDITTQDANLWRQVNHIVDELNVIAQKDYSRFKINPETGQHGHNMPYFTYMRYSTYKANLSGLIAKLHAEYFSDEEPPFKSMPNTIINQMQSQAQSVNLLLEMQEKILEEIPKHEKGSKERTFLEKLKSLLPTVKTSLEVISLALRLAAESGLDPSTVHKVLGM